MGKIIVFIALGLLLLFAPLAGAATITMINPPEGLANMVVIRTPYINFTCDVTGATSGSHVFAYVYDATRYWATVNISTPSDGLYTLSFPSAELPFDDAQVSVNATLVTNSTIIDSSIANFSINDDPVSWTDMVAVKSFDPSTNDLKALHVSIDGDKFMATVHDGSITLHTYEGILNTQGGIPELRGHGQRIISYAPNSSVMFPDNTTHAVGFRWTQQTLKTSNGTFQFYPPRRAFFQCFLLLHSSHSMATTRMTLVDDTAQGGVDREQNFTLYLTGGAYTIVFAYHTGGGYSNAGFGYYTYFETFPAPGESIIVGGSHTGAAWIPAMNAYFAGLGMPWMVYLFGFIVVCLFMGSTYSFARKFNISIPNYVYILMGIVGVTSSWVIGFFDLWVFLFLTLLLVFTLVFRFREQLEHAKALSVVNPKWLPHAKSWLERQGGLGDIEHREFRRNERSSGEWGPSSENVTKQRERQPLWRPTPKPVVAYFTKRRRK